MAISQMALAILKTASRNPTTGSEQGQNHLQFVKVCSTVAHLPCFHLQGSSRYHAITDGCFSVSFLAQQTPLFPSLRAPPSLRRPEILFITGWTGNYSLAHSTLTHSSHIQEDVPARCCSRLPWALGSSHPSPCPRKMQKQRVSLTEVHTWGYNAFWSKSLVRPLLQVKIKPFVYARSLKMPFNMPVKASTSYGAQHGVLKDGSFGMLLPCLEKQLNPTPTHQQIPSWYFQQWCSQITKLYQLYQLTSA